MRYGIISDIHGNLEALRVAKKVLSREKLDKVLCGGDIVGYGADPGECIKNVKELCSDIVCGNHDAASCNLSDAANFNSTAKKAIEWTREKLTSEENAFIKGLSLVYKNQHLTLVHGTLKDPGAFHYMLDGDAARATFHLMKTPVAFVGHTHVPGLFVYKNNRINFFYKEKARISKGEKAIVNTGSVGQPRDGDPRLCYCVYDTQRSTIELKRLPYDIEKAQAKIEKSGLPSFLAHRLSGGV
ncbi:MAG: metallophosphoesterase family protein [Candidatus Omnitrophica bacterium]|nr:metallophosphoesterase family protein [Candidatus Omnitrophota bacterium]